MKKNAISPAQIFDREALKKIRGGTDGYYDSPDEPTDDGGGGGSDFGGGYRCCWTGTVNCSKCVEKAKSNWLCVSGATLSAC